MDEPVFDPALDFARDSTFCSSLECRAKHIDLVAEGAGLKGRRGLLRTPEVIRSVEVSALGEGHGMGDACMGHGMGDACIGHGMEGMGDTEIRR